MKAIIDRMSGDEAALWTKLSTFSIDGPDTRLTFAARLARENGWNRVYTQRVLEEYRKFLFLCCVTPTGVTPSDAVDQAWHLHLTYTKSYWIDLCRHTLGHDIHHNPTQGGVSEGEKFDGMYSHTHDLYEHYFGATPPADIWPENEQRFTDIDFERVNRRTNWVMRKPTWVAPKMIAAGAAMLLVAGLFLQSNNSLLLMLLAGLTVVIITVTNLSASSNDKRRDNNSGGDGGGCGGVTDTGDGHHGGDSDGGGGDSGCSAGGCSSGCGGGCGGGD
ncbi:glycine-rich domain-containing protein [Fibrella aquatica]|uniref:glycine-rich domain-containing protein n=1 Tax=Fibrella aquatica TaxID=3242487 RepID=UPI003520C7D8